MIRFTAMARTPGRLSRYLPIAALLALVGMTTACSGDHGSLDLQEASTCDDLVVPYQTVVADLLAAEGAGEPLSMDVLPPAWNSYTTVMVFLLDEALPLVEALQADLEGWEGVWAVYYVDQEAALEEARRLFADDPGMLKVLEDDTMALPASFRLGVYWDSIPGIVDRLDGLPEARQVESMNRTVLQQYVFEVQAALDRAGLGMEIAAIHTRAEDLGCTVSGVARLSDFSAFEPIGSMGVLIITVAREGLPLALSDK